MIERGIKMKTYKITQCGLEHTTKYGLTKEVAIKLFRQGIEETIEKYEEMLISEDKFNNNIQDVIEEFIDEEIIEVKYPYVITKENENFIGYIPCDKFLFEDNQPIYVKVILEEIDIVEE